MKKSVDAQLTYKKHRRLLLIIVSAISSLALVIATLFTAYASNYNQSFNADAIIYPYFFKNFSPNDIVLAVHHSNILDFPIYILQSILPYNYTSFSVVTMGLFIITVLGWALLLVWMFGKRYTGLICAIMAALLLGSPILVDDLMGNTIRNIEYPIGFAFVIFVARLIRSPLRTKRQFIIGALLFILLSMGVAGDSLLNYCFIAPLLLVTAITWVKYSYLRPRALRAFCLVAGVLVLSALIHYAIGKTGIVSFYDRAIFQPHTVPASSLSFSITTAVTEFFSLWGGYILGLVDVGPTRSIIFLNFSFFIVAIGGFYFVIRKLLFNRISKTPFKQYEFIILVLSISFFATFVIYILADQVVRQLPNGTLISRGDGRYLSLLPLMGVACILYVFKYYIPKRIGIILGVPVFIGAVLFGSLHYIHAIQTGENTTTARTRNSVDEVITATHDNHIPVLLTGYWYGGAVRFWSEDTIMTANVELCNKAMPIANNRLSWYTPDKSVRKSALLVDRSGRDQPYWNCSDKSLEEAYGKPSQIIYLTGVDRQASYQPVRNSLQLWVYNFDLRSKVDTSMLSKQINSTK